MTPEQVALEAREDRLRPVYLLLGEDHFLASLSLVDLRRAVVGTTGLGLNEDSFDASETDGDTVTAAARTLPMMAKRRLVVVRGVERWEPKGESKPEGRRAASLDRLADYAANPSPTTTLVLLATKLDSRRRLALLAKKEGFGVDCETPPKNALPGWLARRAKERKKTLAPGVGELLAEISGPELARLDDAVERLSLFVGDATEIDQNAVAECIVGVRAATVWELTGALGRKDLGAALATLARVYDPRDRGLPLVGTLAWFMRQLIKFSAATARGLAPPEAAKHAGAPPFKAGELAQQTKNLARGELERWVRTLSEVDLALKGGSKRPPQAVLESALIELCARRGAAKAGPRGDKAGARRGTGP